MLPPDAIFLGGSAVSIPVALLWEAMWKRCDETRERRRACAHTRTRVEKALGLYPIRFCDDCGSQWPEQDAE